MLWWKLRQLKSSKPQTRSETARSLGESREAGAVPALNAALQDETADVRRAAVAALRRIAHPSSAEPLCAALVRACSSAGGKRGGTSDSAAASEIAAAAAALGSGAVAPLIRLLADENKEVRRWAARALGMAGDVAAREPLAARLSDQRSEVRREAALALGALGDLQAVEPLVGALGNRDADTRRAAAEALGNLQAARSLDALVKAAEDPSEPIQIAAVGALGRIGGLPAAAGLRKVIDATSRKAVREAAAAALASIRAEAATPPDLARLAVLAGRFDAAIAQGAVAVPALMEALGSRDPRRRLQAAGSLATLRAAEAAEALARVLADSDRTVAEAACHALVQIGSPSVPHLSRTLDGTDVSGQRLAAEALGRIGDPASAGALCKAVSLSRDTITDYPDPHEVARAAHAALHRILGESAAKCDIEDLRAVAEIPDAVLRSPGNPDTIASTIDCSNIRELARRELSTRA